MNSSQRRLLGGLFPPIVLIALVLVPKSRDMRAFYLVTFIAFLLVVYVEILLFGFERRLKQMGKLFLVGFPVFTLLVALLITSAPYIEERPAFWYPSHPSDETYASDSLMLALVPRRNEKERESYERLRASIEAKKAQAIKDWENTRQLVPAERSLRLKDPVDRRTAPYWFALLLLVGVVEFRLLSDKQHESKTDA